MHLATDEPDALYERAVAEGATVVREIATGRFGERGLVLSDPEGLYWSFGTRLPELVRDEHGEWRPAAEM